ACDGDPDAARTGGGRGSRPPTRRHRRPGTTRRSRRARASRAGRRATRRLGRISGRCAGQSKRVTSTSGSRKVLMREIWFAGLVVLTLAGVSPALAQAPKPADDATAQSLLSPLKEDRVLGKPHAPITMIEYAS